MPQLDHDSFARCEIDGTLIFLDIAQDRYFRLSEERNRALLGELDRAGRPRNLKPPAFPCPADWRPPARQSRFIEAGPFRLADVAGALWVQRRIERRLASRSFSSVLLDLRRMTQSGALEPRSPATRIIRAFEYSRLLRSAADRCLPRSIALALCLAARGCRSRVVLGVKLAPFGAHCWTQFGDEVLNDSVEEVLRYTPILIV